MLDAIRRGGHDGNLWPAGPHHAGGRRGSVHPSQEQHSVQPHHLHPHEQTGLPALPIVMGFYCYIHGNNAEEKYTAMNTNNEK